VSDVTSTAEAIIRFLEAVEPMKSHTRSAWTAAGKPESVAAHSWRLCMLAIAVAPNLHGVDTARLLRMCLVHDLGEAIHGDVPAPEQSPDNDRYATEQATVTELAALLSGEAGEQMIDLWKDYSDGKSPEAVVAKALDKIETIAQHNQGANPDGFDYRFNLEYGRNIPLSSALIRELRERVDRKTAELADRADRAAESSGRAGRGDR